MYGNQSTLPDCHTFVSYFQVFQMSPFCMCVAYSSETWPYLNNFDTLFLVMGFISLVCEIQFC